MSLAICLHMFTSEYTKAFNLFRYGKKSLFCCFYVYFGKRSADKTYFTPRQVVTCMMFVDMANVRQSNIASRLSQRHLFFIIFSLIHHLFVTSGVLVPFDSLL